MAVAAAFSGGRLLFYVKVFFPNLKKVLDIGDNCDILVYDKKVILWLDMVEIKSE